jgi:hypothetical protein
MKPYSVNTQEFLEGDEFNSIVSFIKGTIKYRAEQLANKYPDYLVTSRSPAKNNEWDFYPRNQNIPFFDTVCESFLYKDGSGFIEVNEFTYQVNCFSKAIFHRKLWADTFNGADDAFLTMVWDDWQNYQPNGEFDSLKAVAYKLLEEADSLLAYHKSFVYNPRYTFVTVDEVRDMFDQMVDLGIFLSKNGDLYQVFENVNIDTAEMDTKKKLSSGRVSTIEALHIRSKFKVETYPKLQTLTTKFNFVPIHSDLSLFEPLITLVKLDNRVWFIPQFLVFYS